MANLIRSLAWAAAGLLAAAGSASAENAGGPLGWVHGDWRLTVGVTGMVAPNFAGGQKYMFSASPIISLGKAGPEARFTSRNDNISLSLYDNGAVRAGFVGKILFERNADDADELIGLDPVRWGGEAGGFAEIYPTDWLRVRGEVRQGIRAHDGVVADLAVDAFMDVTPTIRGPAESAASGLTAYKPGGGLKSAGVGGAIDWQMTEQVTTSLFADYARLLGPAADSSLVRERGSENQFTVGVSARYRFDFSM